METEKCQRGEQYGKNMGKNRHMGRTLIRLMIKWRRRARPTELSIEGRRWRNTEYLSRYKRHSNRSTYWKRKEAWENM